MNAYYVLFYTKCKKNDYIYLYEIYPISRCQICHSHRANETAMMYNLDEQGRIPIVSNQTVQRPSMSRLKNIRMCHVNIQSLGAGEQGPTSIANVKLDQLRSVLQFQYEFDIIGLSETWLSPSVTDEDISLEEYTVFRKDRPQRGGGVCVYVKSSLPCKRRADLETPN